MLTAAISIDCMSWPLRSVWCFEASCNRRKGNVTVDITRYMILVRHCCLRAFIGIFFSMLARLSVAVLSILSTYYVDASSVRLFAPKKKPTINCDSSPARSSTGKPFEWKTITISSFAIRINASIELFAGLFSICFFPNSNYISGIFN